MYYLCSQIKPYGICHGTIHCLTSRNVLSHLRQYIVWSLFSLTFTLKIDNSIPKKVDFWKRNHPLNHGTASNWQPCNTSHIIITYWRLTTLSISTIIWGHQLSVVSSIFVLDVGGILERPPYSVTHSVRGYHSSVNSISVLMQPYHLNHLGWDKTSHPYGKVKKMALHQWQRVERNGHPRYVYERDVAKRDTP